MAEHRDVTYNRFEFYTYRVGRSDLDRLFAIAAESFSADDIKFETTRNGTTFIRGTLDELISAVASSPLPGNDEFWPELDFTASGGGRRISVEFSHLWLRVWISGPDPTWVHGQTARLRAIVEPLAGKLRPWQIRQRIAARIGGVTAVLVGIAAFFLTQGRLEDAMLARVLLSALAATFAFVIVFMIGSAGKGSRKTLLNVTGEIPDRGWWSNLSTADRIALGGVLFAALAALGALVSAYADVWISK